MWLEGYQMMILRSYAITSDLFAFQSLIMDALREPELLS